MTIILLPFMVAEIITHYIAIYVILHSYISWYVLYYYSYYITHMLFYCLVANVSTLIPKAIQVQIMFNFRDLKKGHDLVQSNEKFSKLYHLAKKTILAFPFPTNMYTCIKVQS